MKRAHIFVYLILICFNFSCVKKEENKAPVDADAALDLSKFKGTGQFTYTGYSPLKDKPIGVFFHIPLQATNQTPILIAFHGNDRSGRVCRDAFIANANQLNFIVIAPEFNDINFPGGDTYNLGNVFVDGDNPTPSTLNAEGIWTFSLIDPVFDFFKESIKSIVTSYDVFGHSAGGQFAQRLLLFKPNGKINNMVISAPGWYTMLDTNTTFPYGTKVSPAATYPYTYQYIKKVHIIVGENDTDPNSADLRHNEIVDKQGLNRLTRAQYFFTQTRNLAVSKNAAFNWNYQVLKNVGHDFTATSNAGALLLYQ
jgi:hypothetical protein